MRIMNGFLNPDNTNNFTCHTPLGKSTVDYLISTQGLSTIINEFNISPKLVESDHTPLAFLITSKTQTRELGNSHKPKLHFDKRFCYIFDKERIPDYKDKLTNESAQDKLLFISNCIKDNVESDQVIKSTYDYVESSIQAVFKKKMYRPLTNNFPINAWYDQECKAARKTANAYAKSHNLNITTNNNQYKIFYKRYKSVIQRKKRLHQKSNRDKLDKLQSTNQTDCWKLWNKLTKKTNITPNQPDIDTFHEYFTNQIYPPNINYFDHEHIKDIENYISLIKNDPSTNMNISVTINVHICDSTITETEVALHIKKLKKTKLSE